eukprot:jgi/Bigna1/85333/estExt_fgenesh1_pg.C_30278
MASLRSLAPHVIFLLFVVSLLLLSSYGSDRNQYNLRGGLALNSRCFSGGITRFPRTGTVVSGTPPMPRQTLVRLIKDPNLFSGDSDNNMMKPASDSGLIGVQKDSEKMEWDPDNVLGPRQSGHLSRLEAVQAEQKNKAEYDRIVAEQLKQAEEARERRDSRTPPEDLNDLHEVIEYFLDTHPEDMEHEIARLRPAITPQLIVYMDKYVNATMLMRSEKNQAEIDKMDEYAALSQVLKEGVIIFDTMKMEALKAQENLRMVLTADDKKAALLELAGRNEIDDTFIMLIESNAQQAQAAGQDKVAEFMLKLREAATRYVIKPMNVPLREGEMQQQDAGGNMGGQVGSQN